MSKIHNKNAFVPLYFVYETAVTVTTSLLSFFSISSTLHTETNTYISFRKGDTFLCILERQFDELCCMNESGIFAPYKFIGFFFLQKNFYLNSFFEIRGILFLHAPLEFPSSTTQRLKNDPKKSGIRGIVKIGNFRIHRVRRELRRWEAYVNAP